MGVPNSPTEEEFPILSRLGRRDSLDPDLFLNDWDGVLPIFSTSACRFLTFSSSSSRLLIHVGALSARKVKHFSTSDMSLAGGFFLGPGVLESVRFSWKVWLPSDMPTIEYANVIAPRGYWRMLSGEVGEEDIRPSM